MPFQNNPPPTSVGALFVRSLLEVISMPSAMPRTRALVPRTLNRWTHAEEVKFTSNQLQTRNDDGVFEGYASLFNRPDLGLDVVAPGAFRTSLTQRGAAGVRMLYQHDPTQPIGVWERIHEDARGLFVRGRLTLEVAKAREVRALMKAGAIDGLSIGFKALKGRRDGASGLRRLIDVDLWEISVVTFPMLPEARIASAKQATSRNTRPTEQEFEAWLIHDAGFNSTEARAVIRAGFQGLKSIEAMKSSTASASARTPAWQQRLLTQMAEAAHLLRRPLPRQPPV
jgi:uncharacterized protein